MLISFSRRFVFIANPKNASTTIQRLLSPFSEVALTHIQYGKHYPYRKVANKFGFLFHTYGVPIECFFRFGVIREPLEWLVSWYNYRTREQLASNPARAARSTLGVSFEEFAEELFRPEGRRAFARLRKQALYFMAEDGELGVDYLIPLPRVNIELPLIGKAFGIEVALAPERESLNISQKVARVEDIPADLAGRLRTLLAADAELYRQAHERAFGDVSEAIRKKKTKCPMGREVTIRARRPNPTIPC